MGAWVASDTDLYDRRAIRHALATASNVWPRSTASCESHLFPCYPCDPWSDFISTFPRRAFGKRDGGQKSYQGLMLARRARRLEHLASLLNTRQRLCTPVWNQKTGRKSDDDASDRIHRFLSRIREPKPLTFGASHSAPRLTGIYWAPTDGLSNERRMFLHRD